MAPVADGSPPKGAAPCFQELCLKFRRHHTVPLNLLLHLVTTPAGLLAAISLARSLGLSLPVTAAVGGVYFLSLAILVPVRLWALTVATLLGVGAASERLQLSQAQSGALLLGAYVGQDVSHYITGESTYQSTYTTSGVAHLVQLLSEHVFFLLPLCWDAAFAAKLGEAVLGWFSMRSNVQWITLGTEAEVEALSTIRSWLDAQDLPKDKTSHWWRTSLPDAVRSSFDHVALAPSILASFRERFPQGVYDVDIVTDMNEVYVAALDTTSATSDNVFYTKHVDGPWFATPWAAVYRCIVSVNPNRQIKTIFPQVPSEAALTTGDAVAFDYNREVHLIQQVAGVANPTQRYSLKLHYVVHPACLPWYGRLVGFLNAAYNTAARRLFVKTLAPKSLLEAAGWQAIMRTTNLWYAGLQAVGGASALVYLVRLALVAYVTRQYTSFPVFLAGSSFVHYIIYISVYYHRHPDTEYVQFKKRVMSFKALALAQLAWLYASNFNSNFNYDPVSLAMIAAGFGLSTSAALALGVNGTYFGVELGVIPPGARVTSFPYNIPLLRHPMIAGNLLWLGGLAKCAAFRAAAPAWLVPLHMALYTLHAVQEEFGIKRADALDPFAKSKAGAGEGAAAAASAPVSAVPRGTQVR